MSEHLIPLRKFNKDGVAAMLQTIASMQSVEFMGKGRQGTPITKPQIEEIKALSANLNLTEEILGRQVDSERIFEDRLDLGKYLNLVTGSLDEPGLWAWLTCLYFEQLCKPHGQGMYLLASDYRYVVRDVRLREYRHLVRTAVIRYREYGEKARLLLSQPVYQSGELTEQTQKTEFLAIPSVLELADRLYFDEEKKKPRKGFRDKLEKGGSLRRMIQIVVPQLTMNYDPFEMEAEQLEELLPNEFRTWKGKAAKAAAE